MSKNKKNKYRPVLHLEDCLAICAYCERIKIKGKTENNHMWTVIESYIIDKSGIKLTHGICPTCASKFYPELLEETSSC